ncbi:MAG: hypothetical protein ABSG26_06690 [Bryobacteraceae bacterium]|jgi:hypothetical protein
MVDGLDEISDPGDRTAFVRNLRAFLGIYPNISLVATSREAGFRHVAGLLATVCTCMRVADFSPDDIRSLTVAWHRHVVGDRPDIIADAERLASAIIENDRIRRLAVNPLMLTTLLLVKRWVGQLPTRRTVLYGKAVEVLLMTWNVEGYDPIDQDEALPQLCYVACDMMQRSTQKISRPDLLRLLRKAREELSAELSFARIPAAEFVSRVELRSSLLMMSGHDVVDGTLTEFYEFRHLTFQEYLAAKGIVEGWYPNRKETDTIVSLLEPHFEDEQWREVIPLGAVLAGRKADALIAKLAERVVSLAQLEDNVQRRRSGWLVRDTPIYNALGNCLADEVQATPETIRQAVRALVWDGVSLGSQRFTAHLVRGKYCTMMREEALKAFMAGAPDLAGPGQALAASVYHTLVADDAPDFQPAREELHRLLLNGDRRQRCQGALGTMRVAFALRNRHPVGQGPHWLSECAGALLPLLFSEDPPEHFAACWALVWIARLNLWPSTPDVLVRLFSLWQGSTAVPIQRMAAWAFKELPLLPRDSQPLRGVSREAESFVSMARKTLKQPEFDVAEAATLVAAYYLRSPWTDAELLRLLKENKSARRAVGSARLAEVAAALAASAKVPARQRQGRKQKADRPRK